MGSPSSFDLDRCRSEVFLDQPAGCFSVLFRAKSAPGMPTALFSATQSLACHRAEPKGILREFPLTNGYYVDTLCLFCSWSLTYGYAC